MNNEFQHSEPNILDLRKELKRKKQETAEQNQRREDAKKIFQTKLTEIIDGNYALHYKRLAQIYINFDQFKNLFLGIGKSEKDVENILKNAQPLPTSNPPPLQQPKQPWEDWDNGELQLSKDGDMVSVKGHVYIRVGNRYEPFNTSTATLYTQDGCLSGSWSLAAKDGQEYKYVSHTEAMKRQMNRQIFYTGQELEDIKQKLKTRYRDAIRMRFVNEFLSNKDRLFKSRCVELFESDPDYDLVEYEKIDPLYNRNLVAEKSNMLRAKEAIVRVEFDYYTTVEEYDQKRVDEETKRKDDEQRRQREERRRNKDEQNRRNEKQKIVSKQSQYENNRQERNEKEEQKLDEKTDKQSKEEQALNKLLKEKNEKEIEFKPTESMFASDSETEAKEQESEEESEAFEGESKKVEEESKTVEGESEAFEEAPKEIELQESEGESEAFEEESKTVEAPKEVVRVDSPMSDDDLMRLMKDDRVLDMLDGLSDSESVREMSMSESDQEVREVKVTVDSDSDKEFSFAATSEDDTLTSMMQNMDAFASDEEDEEEVKWASTSSGAD